MEVKILWTLKFKWITEENRFSHWESRGSLKDNGFCCACDPQNENKRQ